MAPLSIASYRSLLREKENSAKRGFSQPEPVKARCPLLRRRALREASPSPSRPLNSSPMRSCILRTLFGPFFSPSPSLSLRRSRHSLSMLHFSLLPSFLSLSPLIPPRLRSPVESSASVVSNRVSFLSDLPCRPRFSFSPHLSHCRSPLSVAFSCPLYQKSPIPPFRGPQSTFRRRTDHTQVSCTPSPLHEKEGKGSNGAPFIAP